MGIVQYPACGSYEQRDGDRGEGYFDCLRVHQAGFPYVVALMGSALSASQERLLTERFERAILVLDGDAAGRAASRAISTRLSEKCSVVVIDVPEGMQPDQLPFAVIRNSVHRAAPETGKVFETRQ